MKKKYHNILILVILINLLILYLFNAQEVINNSLDYSILFLTKFFPVSFIFFTISSLLINNGLIETIYKYFHINSTKLYVLILSLISGFPSGAKYTKDLLDKKLITSIEANQIIMFSHFPNPLFILGSVNLLLKSQKISWIILISIILSNLIIYLYYHKSNNFIIKETSYNDFSTTLNNAINSTFQILILIYGTSLFFYLISSFITKLFISNSYLYVLVNGLFDLTNGVFSTSILHNMIIKCLMIICFISIGSISIQIQIKSIISNTSISYKSFLKGRLISTILSILIFLSLLIIFNQN